MRAHRIGTSLLLVAVLATGCSASTAPASRPRASSTTTTSTSVVSTSSMLTSGAPTPATRTSGPATTTPAATHPEHKSASPTGRPSSSAKRTPASAAQPTSTGPARSTNTHLPLRFATGSATQILTATSSSTSDTVGVLQAWRRNGSGWSRVGAPVTAHFGSDGLSASPSESRSATPIGSFTLTQAFGHDANPGTDLPYVHTTPSDWWISQPGTLYNTHQRCASNCPFTRGAPNEHLYYEMPFYAHALVIDYNTANAPGGVRQGAGSAFFLHVTDGHPTAGCVSIDAGRLVSLMRWLRAADHPRILIGVGD